MASAQNPFLTSSSIVPEYYFGRESETIRLVNEINSGNNVALISPSKMGKKSLIHSIFGLRDIQRNYFTFFIDIRSTKTLAELVLMLSKSILEELKPFGKNAYEEFINNLESLKNGISYDSKGIPSLNMSIGDIDNEGITLDEIFNFLDEAGKPCILAIDEFQQISSYSAKNKKSSGKSISSTFRTYVQHCKSARFIFSGSVESEMNKLFKSNSGPFFQTVSIINLGPIPLEKYSENVVRLFRQGGFDISADLISTVYEKFDGVTWYMQKVMNTLYNNAVRGNICTLEMLPDALKDILESFDYAYSDLMFRIPEKQKGLLEAISKEGKVTGITSGSFVKKYNLPSQSSVQAAMKGLIEKEYIVKYTVSTTTGQNTIYTLSDKFLQLWLNR